VLKKNVSGIFPSVCQIKCGTNTCGCHDKKCKNEHNTNTYPLFRDSGEHIAEDVLMESKAQEIENMSETEDCLPSVQDIEKWSDIESRETLQMQSAQDTEKWTGIESRETLQMQSAQEETKGSKTETDGSLRLQQIKGDLFEAPKEFALGHCVAEDFVMGKGIAKSFRDKFGQVGYLRRQGKRSGQVAYIVADNRYIFYMVSKLRTKDTIRLHVLQQCLVELKLVCQQLGVTKLALPQLGRGRNQLAWKDVKASLEDIFCQTGMTISVYHCLVQERIGNLLHAPRVYSLAHCVAEDFSMSRGVAKQIKRMYGNQTYLLDQKKKVGEVAVLELGNRYIFYLVTKEHSAPDCKPTLETLNHTLVSLKSKCLKLGVHNLAMPRIATGIDQQSWADVKRCLEDVFSDMDMEIAIYSLPHVHPQANPEFHRQNSWRHSTRNRLESQPDSYSRDVPRHGRLEDEPHRQDSRSRSIRDRLGEAIEPESYRHRASLRWRSTQDRLEDEPESYRQGLRRHITHDILEEDLEDESYRQRASLQQRITHNSWEDEYESYRPRFSLQQRSSRMVPGLYRQDTQRHSIDDTPENEPEHYRQRASLQRHVTLEDDMEPDPYRGSLHKRKVVSDSESDDDYELREAVPRHEISILQNSSGHKVVYPRGRVVKCYRPDKRPQQFYRERSPDQF
jgi:O-acetyl-ADP-ribose deacetylase (regulator of RNase III)